jgi:hypothetical protein
MPSEYDNSSSKSKNPTNGSQKQNDDFLDNGSYDLD